MSPASSIRQNAVNLAILALMIYALGVYSYFTIRFDGNWNENDTMVLTRAIEAIQSEKTLLDVSRPYGNGFIYQAASIFLAEVGGVSVNDLQIYVYPLLTAVLPLIAFVAYREMTGGSTSALLATLFLFLQPDFLFVTWRGSHERFTWTFTLLLLYLLVKKLKRSAEKERITAQVLIFYFVAFGLVGASAFFAGSFAMTLALGFCGFQLYFLMAKRLRGLQPSETIIRKTTYRLPVIVASICVLLFLQLFYIYPPSGGLLLAFRTLLEGFAALFLRSTESVNPYDYVAGAWINTSTFIVLTSFSWFMLISSFMVWCYWSWLYVTRGGEIYNDISRLFLLVIYPAFAAQLALAVVADRVNAIGSNVQVRLFTPLMLAAIPMVALAITEAIQRLQSRQSRRLAAAVVSAVIIPFSVFSLFKTTNEPSLSNNWIFVTESEEAAIDWVVKYSSRPWIWTGFDTRLGVYLGTTNPDFNLATLLSGTQFTTDVRYYVLSDLELARWRRLALPHLYLDQEMLIYDNGSTRVFFRRPRTTFQ
jgi:hypothetical protein